MSKWHDWSIGQSNTSQKFLHLVHGFLFTTMTHNDLPHPDSFTENILLTLNLTQGKVCIRPQSSSFAESFCHG